MNKITLKSKSVSYGLVELRQEGYMYCIYVNGELKEYSQNLDFLMRLFETKYY